MYRCFEWIIFQLPFHKYHCVSCYTLNALRVSYGIEDQKCFLAYNGVDTAFWNPSQVTEQEIAAVRNKF